MKLKNINLFFTFAFFLIISLPVFGQYTIERSVFGSGGNLTSSSNNSIVSTIGQTFTGISNSSNNIANSGFWFTNQTLVAVNDEQLMPIVFELFQNYPNPFNPSTIIKYSIPEASRVILEVYNILGERISTLINAEQNPGFHTVNFNASNLASGFYIYRIQAKDFVQVKKMILMK